MVVTSSGLGTLVLFLVYITYDIKFALYMITVNLAIY